MIKLTEDDAVIKYLTQGGLGTFQIRISENDSRTLGSTHPADLRIITQYICRQKTTYRKHGVAPQCVFYDLEGTKTPLDARDIVSVTGHGTHEPEYSRPDNVLLRYGAGELWTAELSSGHSLAEVYHQIRFPTRHEAETGLSGVCVFRTVTGNTLCVPPEYVRDAIQDEVGR